MCVCSIEGLNNFIETEVLAFVERKLNYRQMFSKNTTEVRSRLRRIKFDSNIIYIRVLIIKIGVEEKFNSK